MPQVALAEVEAFAPAMQAASNALHDTLVLHFQRAYRGLPPTVPYEPRMHACAHALIQLAICVMADMET